MRSLEDKCRQTLDKELERKPDGSVFQQECENLGVRIIDANKERYVKYRSFENFPIINVVWKLTVFDVNYSKKSLSKFSSLGDKGK